MKDSKTLKIGLIGAGIMAICCFTPILVVLLGAIGLSAWLGWLDYVLLPGLAVCMGIAAYGLYRYRRNVEDCCAPSVEATREYDHD